jgi:hypothetical protein
MMKLLWRLTAISLLLGVLAYGSYAVGRYVLSEKLFGKSVTPNEGSGLAANFKPRVSKVTSKNGAAGQAPIQVEVLPANQAAPGPATPSFSDLEKSQKPRTGTTQRSREKVVTPNSFSGSMGRTRLRDTIGGLGGTVSGDRGDNDDRRTRRYRGDDSEEEERPRRRKRRRRRRSVETTSAATRDTSRDSSRSSSSSDDGSRRSRRDSESPTRASQSRSSSTRSEPRRESPVPQPESGGESPVPQPE